MLVWVAVGRVFGRFSFFVGRVFIEKLVALMPESLKEYPRLRTVHPTGIDEPFKAVCR